ncbi:MAG: MarR family transcriptional regulator [Cohaesibacter sp.]|jgi:Mn-dependent DtxR family transcriptional regulator|nr:MarR family transcriptional regulator [Cohaesibacter sp.]
MTKLTGMQKRVLHSLQHLIRPETEKHLATTAEIAKPIGLSGIATCNSLNRLLNKGLVTRPIKGEWGLTTDGVHHGTA